MKRYIFLILVACFVSLTAAAQTLQEANDLYAAGEYSQAAELYQALLEEQKSAELYYNLGNALYKQGELALAIVNYERALRLRPYYQDAKYNLRHAQAQIIDNIEDKDSFFLIQWLTALRDTLSKSWWAYLSICLFLLAIIGTFAFAFAHSIALRKLGFHSAWIALLLSFSSLMFATSLNHRDTYREEAIIIQGIVNAKASPDKSGTDLFTLHEGTKVRIKSSLTDWVEIRVGDYQGWIPTSTLTRI